MQQCEWASVQTWRLPHLHHSPPEPDASHTPAVKKKGQCTDSPTYYNNICAVIDSLFEKTLENYRQVWYSRCTTLGRRQSACCLLNRQ